MNKLYRLHSSGIIYEKISFCEIIPVNFMKISWGRHHKNVQFYFGFLSKVAHAWKSSPFPWGRFLKLFLLFKGVKSVEILNNSEIRPLLAKQGDSLFMPSKTGRLTIYAFQNRETPYLCLPKQGDSLFMPSKTGRLTIYGREIKILWDKTY